MEERQQRLDRGGRHDRPGDLEDPLAPRDPLAGPREEPLGGEREDPLDRRDPLAGEPEGSGAPSPDRDGEDDDEAAARRWEELTDRHETPPAQRDEETDDARAHQPDGGGADDERIGGVRRDANDDVDPDDGDRNVADRNDADRNDADEGMVPERTMVLAPDGASDVSGQRAGERWPEPAEEELERPIETPAAAPVRQPTAATADPDLAAEPAVVHSPTEGSTGPAVAPPGVGTGTPATGVGTPAATPGGTDGTDGAGAREPLVRPDEAGDFTRRWEDVQAQFLDSPRRAVEGAHELLGELMEHLRARVEEQRAGLHGRWSGDTEANTEDLRVTMQGYRDFFRRLLSG